MSKKFNTSGFAGAYHNNRTHKENAEVKFEERAAAKLIKDFQLDKTLKDEIYSSASRAGRDNPWMADLQDFAELIGVYPFALPRTNLRDNAGVSQIFPAGKAAKLAPIREFVDLYIQTQGARGSVPLLLVVPWPHCADGVAVHAVPPRMEIPGVRLCLSAQMRDGLSFLPITIEPIKQFHALLRYEDTDDIMEPTKTFEETNAEVFDQTDGVDVYVGEFEDYEP